MKLFWMNLTKQKFMNWAAGAIIIYHIINSISLNVFLSSNVKLLSPEIYERMMNSLSAQQFQVITMVLLYFFGNKQNDKVVEP